MPRLFAALEVPEPVRIRLSLIGGPLAGARWVEPENMHITLRFAGDIDNRTADEWVGFLDDIEADPFEVSIGELGAFGGREPRALIAAVNGGEPLNRLQRAIERAARNAGLAPETRSFSPHVTLARLKGTTSEEVAKFLGARAGLSVTPFSIDRFVLLSSRPRVGGGPYVVETTFPLGPEHDYDDGDC